jgi:hypothetical protein
MHCAAAVQAIVEHDRLIKRPRFSYKDHIYDEKKRRNRSWYWAQYFMQHHCYNVRLLADPKTIICEYLVVIWGSDLPVRIDLHDYIVYLLINII